MNAEEFRRRLSARAVQLGLNLASADIDLLRVYCELLTRWNRRINLTALPLEPLNDGSVDRLLIEPLLAAKEVRAAPLTWFDLGSGGGSPAIPLRVVRPEAVLTMVEARAKKAAFLREVIRELRFGNAAVLNERFEALRPLRLAHLVTARAVRADADLLSHARGLLDPSGQIFIFGGKISEAMRTDQFHQVRTLPLIPDVSSLTIWSQPSS